MCPRFRISVTAIVSNDINDAPALKQAGIGIAIGSSSGIIKEDGQTVLIKEDLGGIINAIDLSKKRRRR